MKIHSNQKKIQTWTPSVVGSEKCFICRILPCDFTRGRFSSKIIQKHKMTDSYWSNFSPIPSSRLIRIADNDNDDEIDKIIDNHLYGRSIQIFSSNISLQQQVKNFLIDHNEMGFLFVKNLPIFLLIQDEFIQTYWNNGNVYGLSGEFFSSQSFVLKNFFENFLS